MLTEIYIEALLVDEEMADWVWVLWHKQRIDDQQAQEAWLSLIVVNSVAWHS